VALPAPNEKLPKASIRMRANARSRKASTPTSLGVPGRQAPPSSFELYRLGVIMAKDKHIRTLAPVLFEIGQYAFVG
jgi:hypothetical protein